MEAHKLNTKITHSICVVRDKEKGKVTVLTPCGICQERLFYWGSDVRVAIFTPDDILTFKTLEEVQPHHWYRAYIK
jgi:cytidine deaminase